MVLDSYTFTLSELHWMYLKHRQARPISGSQGLWSLLKRLLKILDGWFFLNNSFESFCFFGRHVEDLFFLFLFYLQRFASLTYFSFSFFVPFYRLVFRQSWLDLFSREILLLSPLRQVLKPLSEHYMEDNVRQTVVNSIKASLTEQVSQHTKLKTHWRSSSSSSTPNHHLHRPPARVQS